MTAAQQPSPGTTVWPRTPALWAPEADEWADIERWNRAETEPLLAVRAFGMALLRLVVPVLQPEVQGQRRPTLPQPWEAGEHQLGDWLSKLPEACEK